MLAFFFLGHVPVCTSPSSYTAYNFSPLLTTPVSHSFYIAWWMNEWMKEWKLYHVSTYLALQLTGPWSLFITKIINLTYYIHIYFFQSHHEVSQSKSFTECLPYRTVPNLGSSKSWFLLRVLCTEWFRVVNRCKTMLYFIHQRGYVLQMSVRYIVGWFSHRMGTSVDVCAGKSNNLLDQWQSRKLRTGSRV